MKILVRLPNWLGDMVMSVAFLKQLSALYPDAEIYVVVKKGLEELLPFFPRATGVFLFSKKEYSGIGGVWKFGREIRQQQKFDLFFCLPNSFSSAWMGMASGARQRIGYRNELRSFLLTNVYKKPVGFHRVEEYLELLKLYSGAPLPKTDVRFVHQFQKQDYLVLNINSEASSRRLTISKAVELLNTFSQSTTFPIYMIGSSKEKPFVDEVIALSSVKDKVINLSGKTSLKELCHTLASARLMISTDSGPAHLANALGTQTIVLFGAGNEQHTAPFQKELSQVIRLGQLSCEPCEKNTCIRFATPQCLERLSSKTIVEAALSFING